MLNFFDWIVDAIEIIFGFIQGIIEGLITAYTYLQTSITLTVALSAFLPSLVSGCAMAVITISVIKFIVGRI